MIVQEHFDVEWRNFIRAYPDADGPVYESIVDANVWAPGIYGWELIN